ncbi:hypothetical protein ABZ946_04155 [Streptomyces sp. NPDC046324]|uniref:hypothetical protein n=1 Tax=Streptomyces sp. NPDC046324 TaxID=3154915 RepID=UPI003401B088
MGDHFQTVVDLDATASEAPVLARRALDWLVAEEIVRAEQTDCVLGAPLGHPPGPRWASAVAIEDWEPGGGLRIEAGRTVFHGGQGEAEYATCPHCATRTAFYDEEWDEAVGAWEPFGRAMSTWHTTGSATVDCAHCGRAGALTAWTWADDYYAFGYLGFEFWDWTEFSPRFLDAFAAALGGHRVVRVWGKL